MQIHNNFLKQFINAANAIQILQFTLLSSKDINAILYKLRKYENKFFISHSRLHLSMSIINEEQNAEKYFKPLPINIRVA